VVDEVAQTTVFIGTFKKCNTPAVCVVVGHASALRKATEAEGGIGRVFAVESE
jgi:hypothetical protein